MTADEVRELQTCLKAFGLDPGPIDGFLGLLATVAIKKYEVARLQPVTGTADQPLLERLRRDSSGPIR
ncbi:peptidoglycan-binding domain-containing protein [uncultured Reyranella sp.]|uniref:peptidoglycan-binding domain-containing protein n=1 Tax=uncultured Reyranella sp. TaxID=735512 RepID=UPI00345369D6